MPAATHDIRGESWATEAPDLLAFATKNHAPRSWSWAGQLRRDLMGPVMGCAWMVVAGSLATGIVYRNPLVVFWGCMCLTLLTRIFFSVSRRFAVSQVVEGIVDHAGRRRRHLLRLESTPSTFEPQPVVPRELMIRLPRPAVDQLAREGRLRVLAFYDPDSAASTVLAWRR